MEFKKLKPTSQLQSNSFFPEQLPNHEFVRSKTSKDNAPKIFHEFNPKSQIAFREQVTENKPPKLSFRLKSQTSDSTTASPTIDLTLSASDEEGPKKRRKLSHVHAKSGKARRDPSERTSTGIQVIIPKKVISGYTVYDHPPIFPLPTHHHHSSAFREFARRLRAIPGPPVTLTNDLDDSAPPDNFQFISEYVFRGTKRLEKEFQSGCDCKKDNGRHIGCEYRSCQCLEDGLTEEGKPIGFPYFATSEKKGCLRPLFLETRYVVYECNDLCNCPPECKNRVVQKGRQVPLDIFRTENRGFGLRSPAPLRKGQFIDVYLGEVITDAEATRRENRAGAGKDSYLYSLDKFRRSEEDGAGGGGGVADADLYVVDGEFVGGATRFINHSCAPNCRQFCVSLTRGDEKVYELAFFALDDIPAMTELTFDYVDRDAEEEPLGDEQVREMAEGMGKEPTRCFCGAETCRRYLWL